MIYFMSDNTQYKKRTNIKGRAIINLQPERREGCIAVRCWDMIDNIFITGAN